MKTAVVVACSFALCGLAHAQRIYPDIPENHWVFTGLQVLRKAGFFPHLVQNELGHYRPRYTKSDLAKLFIGACKQAKIDADSFEQLARRPAFEPAKSVAQIRFAKDNEDLKFAGQIAASEPTFVALMSGFKAEVIAQNEDPAELLQEVRNALARIKLCRAAVPGSALVQFSDVPPTHWAGTQILELRRAGIIVGYPGEKFTGTQMH